MSTLNSKPFFSYNFLKQVPKLPLNITSTPSIISVNYTSRSLKNGAKKHRELCLPASSTDTAVVETSKESEIVLKETFQIKWPQKVEGKININLDKDKDGENRQLTVGCTLPGKWILHWGVSYVGDSVSDWDQPPPEMIPPGSVLVKDYAVETPLEPSASESKGETFGEVTIGFKTNSSVSAINFVLKDEETGAWYQHQGRDFKVPLLGYLTDGGNVVGGALGEDMNNESGEANKQKRVFEGFYEEHNIMKVTHFHNSVTVSVKECPETANNLLHMETDLPGDVVVHWGVYKDDDKKWEIPNEPYPAETTAFKSSALRTLLQRKNGGHGSEGLFSISKGIAGFAFVLKLNETTWLNCSGEDFLISIPNSKGQQTQSEETAETKIISPSAASSNGSKLNQEDTAYTDEIITEIRHLVSGISSVKTRKNKTKEAQEFILQEIEKLAAEAYSIFRGSVPAFSETDLTELEELKSPEVFCSGTGSGFEILCQGFNWESQKTGRWYKELQEKASELSSLGFTVVWLPPPTDSVSPEGYMPRDLYNLNSRYGNINELKSLVKKFHEVGIRVLGDVVLNHRCAQYQNQNGVWNMFGGKLNWDDRAIVSDDPHFQGRGNKSSGDNFHAAPNIDHSQEFVRRDIKDWLRWLRKDIGYDGWRLDFVRGFWGGYVKDYLDATEPYFAVGENWDSLSYSYGEMDYDQDAHRQRIVDWINTTNGFAGAFDVTTKGILHSVRTISFPFMLD
ncbi:hypothetical protein Leryth_015799 [Lithospermum erythrorhizon]|nr:hypothetical protein Leryth_015799 [Lithospermum erythrorhizon]